MVLTRRHFAGMAAVASLAPNGLWAQARAASIIALGGASLERPAATAGAFELAIAEGADFIETGIAATQDGTLIARDSNELSASTDVAGRPEFTARKTTKTVDGAPTEGWFTEDFSLADLKTLVCRDPALRARPRNSKSAPDAILTFQDVIDLARAASAREARVIGVCATLRRSSYFASIDLALEPRLADLIRVNGYNWPAAAMVVQSGDAECLKTIGALTRARRAWLAGADFGAGGDFAAVKAYADIIAPPAEVLFNLAAPGPAANAFVRLAHAAGFAVHAQTQASTQSYPPRPFKPGDPRGLFVALAAAGVDAIATRSPGVATRLRKSS